MIRSSVFDPDCAPVTDSDIPLIAARKSHHFAPWRQRLADYLAAHIPLCQAMALEIAPQAQHGLVFEAPLAPNINDKGTAFGGASAALLTLCGWSVIWLLSQQDGLRLNLVIRQSQIRYLRPVGGPLRVICPWPQPEVWQSFRQNLTDQGRARISLEPRQEWNGHLASTMVAEYAGLSVAPGETEESIGPSASPP